MKTTKLSKELTYQTINDEILLNSINQRNKNGKYVHETDPEMKGFFYISTGFVIGTALLTFFLTTVTGLLFLWFAAAIIIIPGTIFSFMLGYGLIRLYFEGHHRNTNNIKEAKKRGLL